MNFRAKKITAKAWYLTQSNKQLWKFGFIASLFSILVGGSYIFYQVNAFKNSKIFGGQNSFRNTFSKILEIRETHPQIFYWAFAFACFVFLGYLIIPIFCSGSLTHLIGKIYKKKTAKHGISKAIFQFLPLMEISALKSSLKPISFFTEFSFIIRNIGVNAAKLLAPVLILFLILGIFLLFFFVFTTPLIILEKNNFSESLKNSSKLVLKNMGTTISLFLIFILIELRVVINVLLIVLLPITFLAVSAFFTQIFLQTTGIIIAFIVAILLIILAAFLTGILYVFSHAIWTIACIEFNES